MQRHDDVDIILFFKQSLKASTACVVFPHGTLIHPQYIYHRVYTPSNIYHTKIKVLSYIYIIYRYMILENKCYAHFAFFGWPAICPI